MGIRVRRQEDGSMPSFLTALSRAASVQCFGVGLGIPLLSLIAVVTARGKLVSDGCTAWDDSRELAVTHRRRSIFVWVPVAIAVIGVNVGTLILSRLPS